MATGRSPKQRTIFESEEPITALGFTEDARQTFLYIVTTNRIMTYITTGKGQGGPPRLLDALGCGLGCVSFRDDGEMIVGRDDAVYLYGGESRVYAYEGTSLDFVLICREKVGDFIVQGVYCCYFTTDDRDQGNQKYVTEYPISTSRRSRTIKSRDLRY